eukprot:2066702-Pleurochrysis_carterae.AAC.1
MNVLVQTHECVLGRGTWQGLAWQTREHATTSGLGVHSRSEGKGRGRVDAESTQDSRGGEIGQSSGRTCGRGT